MHPVFSHVSERQIMKYTYILAGIKQWDHSVYEIRQLKGGL